MSLLGLTVARVFYMIEVTVVRHVLTGSLHACKVATGSTTEALRKEALLFQGLVPHKSVILPVEILFGKALSWIIFPWFPGNASTFKPLNSECFDAYGRQVMDGLRHLHACSVIHADVKPANTLWDPRTRHAVICDLGLAIHYPFCASNCLGAPCSYYTPAYRAPELWATCGRPSETQELLHFRCDVWALGATLLEVAAGYRFFRPPKGPIPDSALSMNLIIQDYITARAGLKNSENLNLKWRKPWTHLPSLVWGQLIWNFLDPVPAKRLAIPPLSPSMH
jgi:serine/threonine protein kinase